MRNLHDDATASYKNPPQDSAKPARPAAIHPVALILFPFVAGGIFYGARFLPNLDPNWRAQIAQARAWVGVTPGASQSGAFGISGAEEPRKREPIDDEPKPRTARLDPASTPIFAGPTASLTRTGPLGSSSDFTGNGGGSDNNWFAGRSRDSPNPSTTYSVMTFTEPNAADVSGLNISSAGVANGDFSAVAVGNLNNLPNGQFAWTFDGSSEVTGLTFAITGASASMPEPSAAILVLLAGGLVIVIARLQVTAIDAVPIESHDEESSIDLDAEAQE